MSNGKFLYLLLVVVAILVSCSTKKVHSKNSIDFTMFLGSGFKNDTVSLSIDNKDIFQNNILQSDSVLGVVGSVTITKKNNLVSVLNSKNETVHSLEYVNNNIIVVGLKINHKLHKLYISLNKGNNVMIDNQSFNKGVSIFQSKKKIILD
jgi:hypothetical protein